VACILCDTELKNDKDRINFYIWDFLNAPNDPFCENVLRTALGRSQLPRSRNGRPDIVSVMNSKNRDKIGDTRCPNLTYRRLTKLVSVIDFRRENLCNCLINKKKKEAALADYLARKQKVIETTNADDIEFRLERGQNSSWYYVVTLLKAGFPPQEISGPDCKIVLDEAEKKVFSYDLPSATSQQMKAMYHQLKEKIREFPDRHLIDEFEILWGHKTKKNMGARIRQMSHYPVLVYFHESFNIIRFDKVLSASSAESLLPISSKRVRKMMRSMSVVPLRRIHTISVTPKMNSLSKDRGHITVTDIKGDELEFPYVANMQERPPGTSPTLPITNPDTSTQKDYHLLYVFSLTILTPKGPKSMFKLGVHSVAVDLSDKNIEEQLFRSLKSNRVSKTTQGLANPDVALFALFCFPSRVAAVEAETALKQASVKFVPSDLCCDLQQQHGKTEMRNIFDSNGSSFIDLLKSQLDKSKTVMSYEYYDAPVLVTR